DRHRVILPVPGELLNAGDHLLGSQRGPGGKLPSLVLSGSEDLHVGSADIDDQHLHDETSIYLAFARVALLEAMTFISSFQELTNALAPSSWSFAAKASTSMAALANWSNTASQSLPSAAMISLSSP